MPPDAIVRPPGAVPRRVSYAIAGFLLGLGAPAGLLLVRSIVFKEAPWTLLREELARDGLLYAYLTLSTALVFSIFGAIVGSLHDKVRRTSLVDPLTALPNRRHLELLLENALERARRGEGRLSLLLIDVDRLKAINDEGGHAAGDAALRAVGAVLRAECRRSDLPARISGDEFAVLAEGADAEQAVALAERVRAALEKRKGAPSVSIGVATLARVRADDAAGILAAADRALYAAKKSGRNRVMEAPPPELS